MVQRQITAAGLLLYGSIIGFLCAPEEWLARDGEEYDDGRLLRNVYLAKAFPVEQWCFTIWTASTRDYWLQFERTRTNCEGELRENRALAYFVARLTLEKIRFRMVEPGTRFIGENQIPIIIGRGPFFTPGVSGFEGDKWVVSLIRPVDGFGSLPANVMSDGKPSKLDGGLVLVHEVGHSRNDHTGRAGDPSNYWAVEMENKLRIQRDPNAAWRKSHNPPSKEAGALTGNAEFSRSYFAMMSNSP
jgi:hypothetical protein